MNINNLNMYISWRDEFLKIVAENFCKECTEPRKANFTINYESPLKCECQCDRVENLLTAAANLESDIKMQLNS